jgi:hypothetical protein
MSDYKIIKKFKPKGKYIHFNQKKSVTGIVNFNDLKKITGLDDVGKTITPDEIIEINFPILDHYFVIKFKSKNGWTLKKLIQYIHKAGLITGNYLLKYQPTVLNSMSVDSPENFINNFSLLSDKKKSDIIKLDSRIYVNLHNNSELEHNKTTIAPNNLANNLANTI